MTEPSPQPSPQPPTPQSQAPATPQPDQQGAATVTSLAPAWFFRMLLVGALFTGFGFWGLLDAVVVYPRRGHEAAEHLEWLYLKEVDRAARFDHGVADPKAELERIEGLMSERRPVGAYDQAKHTWLEALHNIDPIGKSRLDAAYTAIPRENERDGRVTDAASREKVLAERWGRVGVSPRKPLTRWDIPTQWLIMAVGFAGGAWFFWGLISTAGKKYRWNPATLELTLPGGAVLKPADIAEFDKSRWHKFLLTLEIKPGAAATGSRRITIDLYRYKHLEGWVLAMEKAANPDSKQPPDPQPPNSPQPTNPPAAAGESPAETASAAATESTDGAPQRPT